MCNYRRCNEIRCAEEFIRKSPHECLAHISDQDNCEVILRAGGSFDNRQFVRRRLGARWPVWIQDPAELWLNQTLFRQTAVTQAGHEWSRGDKVWKGFTSHWDGKTPSVNNIDAPPPGLSEGRPSRHRDRDVSDGSKSRMLTFLLHQSSYKWFVLSVQRKGLQHEHRWMPTLTHAHARTKHMTCRGL